MEADKDYIFINYSRKDLTKVSPIVEEMRANGYNVWYDANIQPGKDWPDYIAAHIKDCAVCVAFHSQTSRDSQHCREEIHYALKHKKTVISVYLEDVTLEAGLDMQLSRFQAVKYAAPGELLEALRKSPDFERCGENVHDALKKRNHANQIATVIKRGWKRFLFGWKAFALRVLLPLEALLLALAVLAVIWLYRTQNPVWHLDENGVLDIGSLPFSTVEMMDYSYEPDSVSFHPFNPPPWAAKTPLVQCAVIRKGMTYIGSSSFENCSNMKFVFIPEGVTSIGYKAFSGCTALKKISLPYSLESLSEGAFLGCTGLEEIDVPLKMKVISPYLFSGCTGLKSISFQELSLFDMHIYSITHIREGAFEGCTGLEEITIPSSIQYIEYYAFSGCTNLKTVRIQSTPESVNISKIAFDPGAKIIFEPTDADEDVVEYIWGSD